MRDAAGQWGRRRKSGYGALVEEVSGGVHLV